MLKKRYKKDLKLRREVKAMPCFLCKSTYMVDPCHIKTFGSSGIDAWWNLLPLCRTHHNEQHKIGWPGMIRKFPILGHLISHLGWEFLEVNGAVKLYNAKEQEEFGKS